MNIETIYRFRVGYEKSNNEDDYSKVLNRIEEAVVNSKFELSCTESKYVGGVYERSPYIEMEFDDMDIALEAEEFVRDTVIQMDGVLKDV